MATSKLAEHFKGGLYVGAVSRLLLILVTLIYSESIFHAYQNYLYPVWGYYGFTYSAPGADIFITAAIFLIASSTVLPVRLMRPSGVIILFLYAVVYVPTVVVTLCLSVDALEKYWAILLALTIAFMLASWASRLKISGTTSQIFPSRNLIRILLLLWFLTVAINYAFYGSVMSISAMDAIYDQREAGASKNALTAYSQTLFSSVFSPGLFAIGLLTKKHWLTVLGFLGSIFIFSIAAQRTVLLLPVAMYFFYRLLISKYSWGNLTATPLVILSMLNFIATNLYEQNDAANLLAAMLVFRTLAIPGLTYSQYHEIFSQNGYTLWSHVKGLSLLVETPYAYIQDKLWPNLGYMIGERVYGNSDLNANANLFSGDGIAAAGWLGVLVIGIVFSVWLRLLDRVSRNWDTRFACLAVLPFSISLTNGHFFTSLVSFGGLAWLLIFSMNTTYKYNDQALRLTHATKQ